MGASWRVLMCKRKVGVVVVIVLSVMFFFFQAEDGIRDVAVTGVQTCALPISSCPFVLWCLISAYKLSRCCCTSARSSSPCTRSGLSKLSLLFKAMSRLTSSSFTWQFINSLYSPCRDFVFDRIFPCRKPHFNCRVTCPAERARAEAKQFEKHPPCLPRAEVLASVTEGMDMSKPSDLVQGTLDMLLLKILALEDRKSTRLNSSHGYISYAVF